MSWIPALFLPALYFPFLFLSFSPSYIFDVSNSHLHRTVLLVASRLDWSVQHLVHACCELGNSTQCHYMVEGTRRQCVLAAAPVCVVRP